MKPLNRQQKARLAETAKEVLQPRESVVFAYLFGSAASAEPGSVGDVDLALYLKEPRPTLEAQLDLERGLRAAFQKKGLRLPVDCVIMNTAALGLKAAIFQKGRLLFARDEALLTDLIEKTTRQFLAEAPLTTAYFFERIS